MPENIGEANYREEEVTPLRKAIAQRMAESKSGVPHFYLTVDVDMEKLIYFRNNFNNRAEVKVSYNDILMKAVAEVFKQYPEYNISYHDGKVRYYENVNISLAVAVEGGLLTPTIRECEKKSILQINSDAKILIEKARNKKLRAREQMGGVFTITNLGMFGIEEFMAIINPPQSMILAVGAIRDVPVIIDGEIVPGKRMKMTLSVDHRALDGAMASIFLDRLRKLLESSEELNNTI